MTSSPRLRRLKNDFDRITTRFKDWPLVQIELADGLPPDLYRISYRIKGLYASPDGHLHERREHVIEIRLGLEYPRRAPQLRLLTPLFHPNFNKTEICAQDNYAASEGLDDLIIRIGRMIAYQEYNIKSPLNGLAAKWAAENSGRLPVDRREMAPPNLRITNERERENVQIAIKDTNRILMICPNCAATLRIQSKYIGREGKCRHCGMRVKVTSK